MPGTKGKEGPAKRDGQAARRAFERLLFDDGAKGHLAELRSATGFGSGHDLCELRIWLPAVRDDEATQDVEDLYARQLTGPRGMIEDLVLQVNRLCDHIDPDGARGGNGAQRQTPREDSEPDRPAAKDDNPAPIGERGPAPEGGDAPDALAAPAADDEDEEGAALPSLSELTKDLPLDRNLVTEGIVDVPAALDVLHGFQVAVRTMAARLSEVGTFIAGAGVCEEEALDNGLIAKEAARLACRALEVSLDELHESLFCYLNHVGAGRLVELNDEALAAVRELARAAPWHYRQARLLVPAAVQYVARLPHLGGILADAEQRRRMALEREPYRSLPRQRRVGWPWADVAGRPLTVESEYEPSGELADGPKPRARSA